MTAVENRRSKKTVIFFYCLNLKISFIGTANLSALAGTGFELLNCSGLVFSFLEIRTNSMIGAFHWKIFTIKRLVVYFGLPLMLIAVHKSRFEFFSDLESQIPIGIPEDARVTTCFFLFCLSKSETMCLQSLRWYYQHYSTLGEFAI